jgi:beta-hydroxylase
MSNYSLWDRVVQWTTAAGERILAPIERFIGKRSLVGDATFFELERFPWVAHIEENWEVILGELQGVLADREALPNFQDISKDQIEITDDDRWKTFFLYGYGFEAKLGVEMCPRSAALMREIPGMTTAMFSILSPRKHILDHRGPYKGVLRYHLGLIVPQDAAACRIRVGEDFRHWEAGKSMVFDDTFNHEVWNDTDETRVVLFVDVLRPLPFPENKNVARRGSGGGPGAAPRQTRPPEAQPSEAGTGLHSARPLGLERRAASAGPSTLRDARTHVRARTVCFKQLYIFRIQDLAIHFHDSVIYA